MALPAALRSDALSESLSTGHSQGEESSPKSHQKQGISLRCNLASWGGLLLHWNDHVCDWTWSHSFGKWAFWVSTMWLLQCTVYFPEVVVYTVPVWEPE